MSGPFPQRILRPSTAFSTGGNRKRPRIEEPKHLAFIRKLPCVACGTRRNIEAAHIRMGSILHGKRQAGLQEKPDDKWSWPACPRHHDEQHSMNEAAFWSALAIDPFLLALLLHDATGDEERAEGIIRAHREIKP
jgi:hypothetical protein